MSEFESLQFTVESKAESAGTGIKDLADNLKALKSALGGSKGSVTTKLQELSEALEKVSASSEGVTKIATALSTLNDSQISKATANRLGKISDALNGFNKSQATTVNAVANSVNNLAKSLISLQKASGGMNISQVMRAVGKANDVNGNGKKSQTAQQIGQSEQAQSMSEGQNEPASGAASGFERIRAAASVASVKIAEMVGHLKKLGSVGMKVGGTVGKALLSLPQAVGTRFISGVKAATSRLGGLFASLKRIAMYRAFRAIFSAITGGIKEGVKNIYEFSRAAGGTFVGTMNGLASSFQYLKNSMGAVAAPLLSVLAPAIDYIINKVVTLLNLLAQLFARLSGATHYTAAKKAAATYGAAAGKASGAAKELKKTIMSFDEIHKLDDPAGSGGGGGGGGGGGVGDMFEDRPIDAGISEFADKLKAAFKAGDWKELGTLLGNKFNEIVDSIDWAGIGKRVGYWLNGAIETSYYTLHAANFQNLGKRIAEFFNAGLEEINGESFGRLLVRKLTIAFDLVIGFINSFDFGQLAKVVSAGIKGIFSEMADWLQSVNWHQLGMSITEGIIDIFANADWAGMISAFASYAGAAFAVLPTLLSGIIDGFLKSVSSISEDDLENFLSGMKKWPAQIKKWVKTHVIQPFKDAFNNIWDQIFGNFKFPSMEELFGDIAGLFGGSSKKTASANIPVNVELKKSNFGNITDFVGDKVSVAISLTKQKWDTIKKFVGDKVSVGITLAKTGWDNIKKFVGTAVDVYTTLKKSGWSSISAYVGSTASVAITLWKKGWSTIASYIGTTVEVGISLAKKGWTSIKSYFGLASGGIIGANGGVRLLADGGILSNGVWNSIPKYAGGTSQAHGSMFVAGEKGPEIVGHVNGKTEVLNKSQLASAMYSAMVAGMQTFSYSWNNINRNLSVCTDTIVRTLYDAVENAHMTIAPTVAYASEAVGAINEGSDLDYNAIVMGVSEGVTEANLRQNEILREQNDLLRELLDKEFTAEMTTSSFSRAINHKNLRDGRVGTPAAI